MEIARLWGRFRYNSIQSYALYNGLWQQKLRIRDEGYRRPADAALGISGMRTSEEREAGMQGENSLAF